MGLLGGLSIRVYFAFQHQANGIIPEVCLKFGYNTKKQNFLDIFTVFSRKW